MCLQSTTIFQHGLPPDLRIENNNTNAGSRYSLTHLVGKVPLIMFHSYFFYGRKSNSLTFSSLQKSHETYWHFSARRGHFSINSLSFSCRQTLVCDVPGFDREVIATGYRTSLVVYIEHRLLNRRTVDVSDANHVSLSLSLTHSLPPIVETKRHTSRATAIAAGGRAIDTGRRANDMFGSKI